jgi:hypothetical protein
MGQCTSVKSNDEFEIQKRKFQNIEKQCGILTKILEAKHNVNDMRTIKYKYEVSRNLPLCIEELYKCYNELNVVYRKQEAALRPGEKGLKQRLLKQAKDLLDKYHHVPASELVYN